MDPLMIAALIGAGVGLVGNTIGWFSQNKSQKDYINQQIGEAKDKKASYADYLNKAFELEKTEASLKSERMNKELNQAETQLNASVNNQLDALRLSEEGQGLSFNMQMQSSSAETGNALSTLASSGTRNSSALDAVDMIASQNAALLQNAEDQTRSQDKISFTSLLNSFAQQRTSLQNGRTDAGDLITRYLSGGLQQSSWQNNFDYNMKQHDVAINGLQQNYDGLTWKNNFWGNLGSLGATMLGGSTSGLQTGYNVGTILYKAGL